MRRVVPWTLLLLLGLGAGLGAAVGIAGSDSTTATTATAADLTGPAAQQWLSGVLAATKAAGTARVSSTEITASPNPDLRSAGSGTGVVDFTTGNFRFSDTEHTIEWTSQNGGPAHAQPQTTTIGQIAVGRSLYDGISLPGFPDHWSKLSFPAEKGELALAYTDEAGMVLAPLTKPFSAVAVSDLGTTVVNGERATRYLVQVQEEPSSAAVCTASTQQHRKPLRASATVWVDGQDRLVQARVSNSSIAASPANENPSLGSPPSGPYTVTSTLRFSALGAPVHIARPTPSGSGSGSGFAITTVGSSGYGSAVFCG